MNKILPFHNNLTVNVVDSAYGMAPFLGAVCDMDNLVTVARLSGNRVLYHQPTILSSCSRGRPKSFGNRFDMHASETWGEPDKIIEHFHLRRSGKPAKIKMDVWNNMLMRGKREYPMHQHPFTLIRSQMFNEDGSLVFNRPLWLIVFGKRRDEVSPMDAWGSYQQRFDMEHFFRFGKRRLFLDSYQTSILEHEENWWEIASLAYFQLWMSAPLAVSLPTPWERYVIPRNGKKTLGPSLVQRDFERIIRQIGERLPPPKPRGKSPGRNQGDCPGRRKRHPVVFKGKKKAD